MNTYFVVTGFIKYKNKFLILKKRPNDRNFPNRWSFCSGYAKEFESAEDGVLREIKEETGIIARIVKKGGPIVTNGNGKRWVIMTFVCRSETDKVNLCHENVDYAWMGIKDISKYNFVPGIKKGLKSVGLIK